jgi:hypothetical protein
MREVKYTSRFRRDYRRERSGRHGKRLDALLVEVVNLLAADQPLPRRNVDHPLSGDGRIFATATSGPISSSSTARRTTIALSWCALARTANWVGEGLNVTCRRKLPTSGHCWMVAENRTDHASCFALGSAEKQTNHSGAKNAGIESRIR